jgi:hypothetical protein
MVIMVWHLVILVGSFGLAVRMSKKSIWYWVHKVDRTKMFWYF